MMSHAVRWFWSEHENLAIIHALFFYWIISFILVCFPVSWSFRSPRMPLQYCHFWILQYCHLNNVGSVLIILIDLYRNLCTHHLTACCKVMQHSYVCLRAFILSIWIRKQHVKQPCTSNHDMKTLHVHLRAYLGTHLVLWKSLALNGTISLMFIELHENYMLIFIFLLYSYFCANFLEHSAQLSIFLLVFFAIFRKICHWFMFYYISKS